MFVGGRRSDHHVLLMLRKRGKFQMKQRGWRTRLRSWVLMVSFLN